MSEPLGGVRLTGAPRRWLVVDREHFTLELWTRRRLRIRWELAKRYRVAVGAKGFATPRGLYLINTRARCPQWQVPDSDWARDAGLEPGTVVPGCTEQNPLKARWLGVTPPEEGVGIHGTGDVSSLGSRASHGCIRMAPADVIELFDLVPKGTPIYIF